ncbi:MAG TPA: hypothetical protein VGO60_10365 [Iamia sp.]|jgi:hypothetical protein|nr:hypothetical protein [Iamia sp.]
MAADDDLPENADPATVIDTVADRAAAVEPGEDDLEEGGADEVAAWQRQLAQAAISPRAQEALTAARHHLDNAWHSSDAGTEDAPAGKLRHAHKVALVGMKHVTSHQVPFNRELVVAIDRLTRVVEELATRLSVVDELEERYDATLRRAQAGVATAGVQIDDLAGELAEVFDGLEDATARLAALEATVADQRQVLGATRAREDVVLRALKEVPPNAAETVRHEAEAIDATLIRRLAVAGRPRPEVVVGWARQLEPVVAAAAAGAPVLDLDPDRGEWLDVWAGLPDGATGVESDPTIATALRERGHAVADGRAGIHLGLLPAASLGAVTAVALADVRPLAELVAVVDGASAALRPGGVLVLVFADPAGASTGDVLWADPRRRPLHPATLELLAFERGFAEAEIVDLGDGARALVARTAGGAPSDR